MSEPDKLPDFVTPCPEEQVQEIIANGGRVTMKSSDGRPITIANMLPAINSIFRQTSKLQDCEGPACPTIHDPAEETA